MPGVCRTLSVEILMELDYFLLFSTMSSIPVLDKLIAMTTPSEKIIIGTNSSIGISLPPCYVKVFVKRRVRKTHQYPRHCSQSTEIPAFMQLIIHCQHTQSTMIHWPIFNISGLVCFLIKSSAIRTGVYSSGQINSTLPPILTCRYRYRQGALHIWTKEVTSPEFLPPATFYNCKSMQ
jgi:hypothetical protein